jgi:photosystem II stability/assembly factor-like uncharacterized protein
MKTASLTILAACLMLCTGSSQAEWTKVSHPGTDVRSLAFSANALFGVGSKKRMFYTTNSGESWADLQVVRYGTDYTFFKLSFFQEITLLGTNNGGIRWARPGDLSQWTIAPTAGIDDILAFAESRGKTSVAYLAGGFGGGIRVSSDSGKTWTPSNNGLSNTNVTSLVSGPSLPDSTGQVILAGTYGDGVFASTDNGQSWSPRNLNPSARQVNAMEVAGGYLYAAGSGGKVYRSSDWGNTWQEIGTGLPDTELLCITILKDAVHEWVYCGTIDRGVWRCPTSGGTWTSMNTGLGNLHINSIVAKDSGVYAGTLERVYRSWDGGLAWALVGGAVIPQLNTLHAFTDSRGRDLLMAGTAGIYWNSTLWDGSAAFATQDDGVNWTPALTYFGGSVVSITHRDDLLLLLASGTGDNCPTGMHISTDLGSTWENRLGKGDIGGSLMFGSMKILPSRTDSSRLNCFLGSAVGPATGLFFSQDTGRSWTYNSSLRVRCIGSADSFLVIGATSTSGFVKAFRTSDYGATWDDITLHLSGYQVKSLFEDGTRLLATVALDLGTGQPGGILATTDAGDTWVPAGLGGKTVSSLVQIGNYLLATADGRFYGASRDSLDWVDFTGSLGATTVKGVTATSQSCYVLGSDGKSIWKRPFTEIQEALSHAPGAPHLLSPINGTTGQSVSAGLRWTRPAWATSFWLQVGVDSLFSNPLVFNKQSLADTFALVTGLNTSQRYYWRVAACNSSGFGPWSGTWSFTTIPPPPWRFANTGTSHTIIIPPGANPNIDGSALVAGDYVGVFFDSSGTLACAGYEQWTNSGSIAVTAFGDDPTTTVKDGFAAGEMFRWKIWRQSDSHAYVAIAKYVSIGELDGIVTDTARYNTNGISAIATLTGSLAGVKAMAMPTQFSLMQNYPNPFNPITSISFGLPVRSHVRLTIYNTLGEQVTDLVNGEMEAGYHTVQFDGKNLSSGVYFYRIVAGNFTETRRLLLIR